MPRFPLILALVGLVAITSGCETAPIKVTPLPDIKAVRTSNTETRAHIRDTQTHIDKVQKGEGDVTTKLKSADAALTELLNQ